MTEFRIGRNRSLSFAQFEISANPSNSSLVEWPLAGNARAFLEPSVRFTGLDRSAEGGPESLCYDHGLTLLRGTYAYGRQLRERNDSPSNSVPRRGTATAGVPIPRSGARSIDRAPWMRNGCRGAAAKARMVEVYEIKRLNVKLREAEDSVTRWQNAGITSRGPAQLSTHWCAGACNRPRIIS